MITARAPAREIFGWAMFDFANSSYTTVIITVVYNVVFTRLIVGDGPEFRRGNLYWSLALSASYLLVVVSGPLLGAIMDFSAAKKKFLMASTLLTVGSTALLYWVGPGAVVLAAVLIILSNFGFASGESFVSSFLPELGPPEDLGKISGYAWSLGYFGGLASTALVIFGLGPAAAENMENLRWVGPVTAVFFALSAIPTFLLLKERGQARPRPSGASYLSIGCERLGRTLRELGDFRDLLTFLISLFFAMAGLSIVIAFAFIYGDQVIGWDARTQMLMFILTQLSAAGGALGFGWLQDRMGSKRTFDLTLILWVVSVTLIYGTEAVTASLNDLLGTRWQSQHVFLAAGCLAGCGLGATQSASRALVGLFTPASKSGEFFGFWGLAGKLASVVGILALGALQSQVGLERSILLCSLFFLLALGVNLLVDERRGRARAMEHQGE